MSRRSEKGNAFIRGFSANAFSGCIFLQARAHLWRDGKRMQQLRLNLCVYRMHHGRADGSDTERLGYSARSAQLPAPDESRPRAGRSALTPRAKSIKHKGLGSSQMGLHVTLCAAHCSRVQPGEMAGNRPRCAAKANVTCPIHSRMLMKHPTHMSAKTTMRATYPVSLNSISGGSCGAGLLLRCAAKRRADVAR